MAETYNFRAPQYVDFLSAVNDSEDNDFFDFDMDTGNPLPKELSSAGNSLGSEPVTPYQDAEDHDDMSSSRSSDSPKSRHLTSHKRQTLSHRSMFDGIELEPPPEKAHSMKTRLDSITRTPRLELRSRSIVKAMAESPLGVEPLAQYPHSDESGMHQIEDYENVKIPEPAPRKRKLEAASHGEPPAKFISMAEHVIKIQKQTPARFHTKPRFDGVTKKTFGGPSAPKSITIPHTPALVSHLRHRPVHALTREEEELRDFEEAQKAKFKAIPLKDNHFKSRRVAVQKKPPTQVQPFHLTEYKPKPRAEDDAVVVFKARPVPKAVLSGPKVEVPKKIKLPAQTKPAPICSSAPAKVRPTVVKPFSFEGRGCDWKAKREKFMKEVRKLKGGQHGNLTPKLGVFQNVFLLQMEEQDRKAKEFKARPLPPSIQAAVQSVPKRLKPNESEEAPLEKFKARDPVVLKKAPFVPAKPARTPLEPKPFNLHSEARSLERQKFDLVMKQKELEHEHQKRLQEEMKAQQLAEEIAQLRRDTVHHARPVPQYRQFNVKPSEAHLTNPHSPNFMKRLRSQKAKTSEVLNTTFEIKD